MSVIRPALECPELIAYFSGANNYSWLHFRNGEKKLLAKPISYLEKKLPNFIRVHKTVLINPTYVKTLHRPPRQKMAGGIQLDSGELFPVSRRRWHQVVESLQPGLALVADTAEVKTDTVSQTVTHIDEADKLSILLITDDEQNASLTKQIVEKKWPAYQFQVTQQSSHLPDLLKHLPQRKYPTLIFLDARTTTLERLHTLQRLKEDSSLSSIPIILLVSPVDQLVINGYQQQANSVVSMPTEYILFRQTIERICQFWLHIVTLPSLG